MARRSNSLTIEVGGSGDAYVLAATSANQTDVDAPVEPSAWRPICGRWRMIEGSEDYRVAALRAAVRLHTARSELLSPGRDADPVMWIADRFYAWLTRPVRLHLHVSPITTSQGVPGSGQPTITRENSVQLADNQQVTLTVGATDSKGQPTSDTLTWASDNTAVVAVQVAADTMSATAVAGNVGSANVTVTDPNGLTATEPFVVVAGAATTLTITAGTPTSQPATRPANAPATPPAA